MTGNKLNGYGAGRFEGTPVSDRGNSGRQPAWQKNLIRELGIVDEGDIVPLSDLDERMEFDERILSILEGRH